MKKALYSLAFKLGLAVFMISAISFAGLGFYCTQLFSRQVDEQLLVQMQIPGQLMNQQALPYSTARDCRALSKLVGEKVLCADVIRTDQHIHYSTDPAREGTFFDSQQEMDNDMPSMAETFCFNQKNSRLLNNVTPLFAGEKSLGMLHLEIDTCRSSQKKREIASIFFIGGLLCILVTTFVGAFLIRCLTLPRIKSAVHCLQQVASGSFAVRIQPADSLDELGLMERGINHMVDHLEARQQEDLRLYAKLEFAKEIAENASRSKGEFLTTMSHEIRTPLNAVLGHAQIISRECRSCPSQKDSVFAILKSGNHLLELINDILRMARTDTYALKLQPSNFNIHQLLESLHVLSGQKLNTATTLKIICYSDLPQFLYADKVKIREVLINLVGNAVKFTDKGSIFISAGTESVASGNARMLYVDVQDTGSGIKEDCFESIFDPFELLVKRSKSCEGTGLGLALSLRYAQAMGGNVILLHSTPGRGSTFRFTFTAQTAEPTFVPAEETSSPVCCITPGWRIPHILVVDKDEPRLQLIDAMLKEVGFFVEPVENGSAATRLLSKKHYDCILMDQSALNPEEPDSGELLRNLAGNKQIPIAIIADSPDQNPSSELLADSIIYKPVDRENLLKEMRKLTGVQYEYDHPSQPIEIVQTDKPPHS